MMKKIFFLSLLLVFVIGLAPDVFAQSTNPSGFTALAPIPGLTSAENTSVINSNSLANFFNNLYKYLIGLSAVLAVIMIIWGGLEISTQDSISKQGAGREKIYNAIFGLVLVLSPALVFSIINPSILNLSIDLKPLDTKSGALIGNSGGGNTTPPPAQSQEIVAATSAGCTITTGTLAQNASCPTQQAAQAFADACTSKGGNGRLLSTVSSEYLASCDVISVACTTTHTGPYLETAVCASQNDATAYKCSNGLSLIVPACKTSDATTGKCLDGSVNAYCASKTINVQVYSYYQSYTGILKDPALFVPRDEAAAAAFKNGCQSDGGVYSASKTTAALAFLSTGVGVHLYQTTATNGCSSDYGTIPFDSSKGGGIVCYGNVLSCDPPL